MRRRALASVACVALTALAGCDSARDEAAALRQGRIVFVFVADSPDAWVFSLGSADLATGRCRRIRSLPPSAYRQETPFPALSPTGDHLAQIVRQRNRTQLRVTSLATGRTRAIARVPDYPNVEWSSDGSRLAYKHGSFWVVVTVDGGAAGVIRADPVGGFAWSPDRTQIAFTSTRGDGRAGTLRTTMDVMAVDGVGRRTLYVEPNPYASQPSPTWSPDGRTIVFGVQEPLRIFAVSATGGPARQLSGGTGPLWSPSGDEIAFAGRGPHGALEVFVMRADGAGQRRLTTTRPGRGNRPLGWSPAGDAIVYGTQSALAVMTSDGSEKRVLCRFPGGAPASAVWTR